MLMGIETFWPLVQPLCQWVDIKQECKGKTAAIDVSAWFYPFGCCGDGERAEGMILRDPPQDRAFIRAIVQRAKREYNAHLVY